MKKLITHSGVFHADDVFATAWLQLYFGVTTVERVTRVTEEMKNDSDTIIYDIGFGEFDHHQADAATRPDGCKHSAFGLVAEAYPLFATDSGYDDFARTIVIPIEDSDNGLGPNPLSTVISNMTPPYYDDTAETQTACFNKAVEFAKNIIRDAIRREGETLHAADELKPFIDIACGVGVHYIILDRFVPYQKVLYDNIDINYVVFPSNRGGYNIMTVMHDADHAVSLPEAWLTTHPQGCTFVHQGLFIAAFATLEDAYNAVRTI